MLFALVGLVGACAAPAGPKAEPAPAVTKHSGGARLAFDNRAVDYGSVAFGQPIEATFRASNVGDKRLAIRKVDVKAVQGC